MTRPAHRVTRPGSATPVIVAEGVAFGYRGTTAVTDLDLLVRPGQVVALVGGDGAGKTTTLRGLAGRLRPLAGRLRLPMTAQMGVLPEGGGVFTDLTVAENLAFAAAAHRLPPADCDDLLARMDLSGARDRLAGRLSGGMRQKLALAMALVHRPAVLLLDEPTTGVDPVSRSEIWRLLSAEATAGTAIVLATTYLDEATRATTVLVLEDGRVIRSGSPAQLDGHLPRPITAAEAGRHPGATILQGAGLVRRFGDHTAVAGIDLDVSAGEVVGLLGANGAGKTTLIRMLLGLLAPSAGTVRLLGAAPSRRTRHAIGYVPQHLSLYGDLSVAQNRAFHHAAYGTGDQARTTLPVADDAAVGDLSLGQQRRLAFELALAHDPSLLVLDEPTSGVGPGGRVELWQAISTAAADGCGVLVTTHHLAEAEQCDRLVVMAAGRVVAAGTLPEILGGSTLVAVITSDPAAILGAMDRAGLAASLAAGGVVVPGADEKAVHAGIEQAGLAGPDVVIARRAATLDDRFVELADRMKAIRP